MLALGEGRWLSLHQVEARVLSVLLTSSLESIMAS